jgi:hypothetical protein
LSFPRPHTITVTARSSSVDGTTKEAKNPTRGAAQTVRCNWQDLDPKESVEIGVQPGNSANVYFLPADASKFGNGYEVSFQGKAWSVFGEPVVRDPYAMVLVTRKAISNG